MDKKIKKPDLIKEINTKCEKFVKKMHVLNKKQEKIMLEYKKALDKIKAQ